MGAERSAAPSSAPKPPVPGTALTILLPSGPSVPSIAPAAVESAPARATRVPAPIAWETSEPVARERALRAGRPLLVWVRADWAVGALEMERTTWSDPRVVEAARPFVALRLDVSAAEGDAERYAERYQVTGLPTTVLVDIHGARIAGLVGYQDADRLATALQRAAE
jgi:thiol:disulfide interchange protein